MICGLSTCRKLLQTMQNSLVLKNLFGGSWTTFFNCACILLESCIKMLQSFKPSWTSSHASTYLEYCIKMLGVFWDNLYLFSYLFQFLGILFVSSNSCPAFVSKICLMKIFVDNLLVVDIKWILLISCIETKISIAFVIYPKSYCELLMTLPKVGYAFSWNLTIPQDCNWHVMC